MKIESKIELAPVALFVYNRPVHTRRVLQALMNNDLSNKSELYIFSDGPKNSMTDEDRLKIEEVRSVIREEKWCNKNHIIEQTENKGLSASIIRGVTEVVNRHGKVIVLEDDIVTAPVFLRYMNEALEYFKKEERIVSISSYNYFALSKRVPPFFFSYLIDCWGWATWKHGWDHFEQDSSKLLKTILDKGLCDKFNVNGAYNYFEMLKSTNSGIVDSWAIRWYASGIINDKLSLYPKRSLVKNIGFDGSGMNSRYTDYSDGSRALPSSYPPINSLTAIENNNQAMKEFVEYFQKKRSTGMYNRALNFFSRLRNAVRF